jgi:hypothetical protein
MVHSVKAMVCRWRGNYGFSALIAKGHGSMGPPDRQLQGDDTDTRLCR